jgi:hypothetical protein
MRVLGLVVAGMRCMDPIRRRNPFAIMVVRRLARLQRKLAPLR